MFDAYKRFFRFSGTEKSTWYKGMAFELLRSIFEALQFVALLIVLRALVEQNITGATAWTALGIMVVSVAGAALCWYLAHNSEGHANYRMCGEKRIHIGERMKYMPMGYFNAQSLGSLTAAATSTMSDLESMSFAVIARTVVGMIRTAAPTGKRPTNTARATSFSTPETVPVPMAITPMRAITISRTRSNPCT